MRWRFRKSGKSGNSRKKERKKRYGHFTVIIPLSVREFLHQKSLVESTANAMNRYRITWILESYYFETSAFSRR